MRHSTLTTRYGELRGGSQVLSSIIEFPTPESLPWQDLFGEWFSGKKPRGKKQKEIDLDSEEEEEEGASDRLFERRRRKAHMGGSKVVATSNTHAKGVRASSYRLHPSTAFRPHALPRRRRGHA